MHIHTILFIVNAGLEQIYQGYRLTFCPREQAGPHKQNDWGPSPKLRGPGFGGKLNSFQHHCKAFALLKIKKGVPENLYSSNHLPYRYLESAE